MSIHTILPWKKFRNPHAANWTWKAWKSERWNVPEQALKIS
jgi:hypothetical protein